jgi:regulator of protease activity HflC (stomatin/prohibitin superfamily)
MKTKFRFLLLLGMAAVTLLQSCAVVRQGEVGLKRTSGRLSHRVLQPGLYGINPFVSVMRKIPVRTQTLQAKFEALPTQEGLAVGTEITTIYRIMPDSAFYIEANLGSSFEQEVILPVLRSATADVTSRFTAKDLYTAERSRIEKEIITEMTKNLGARGFVIEAVLLKCIFLPEGLLRSIEQKLQSEQEAQRMQFVLQREKQEAERKRVEAEGIRDAQKIISEGLTPLLIQFRTIDAFRELSKSPNSKLIITDGKSPIMLNPGQ